MGHQNSTIKAQNSISVSGYQKYLTHPMKPGYEEHMLLPKCEQRCPFKQKSPDEPKTYAKLPEHGSAGVKNIYLLDYLLSRTFHL